MVDQNRKEIKSALHVNEGINQPSPINSEAALKYINKNLRHSSIQELFDGIRSQNRTILSKAITLVESSLISHNNLAQELINKCLPYSGNSIRIGITGIPGAGKSTFIESFGKQLTSLGHRIAVLAIDPSSSRTKGSILGDKTRMEELSTDENAFIRPSPSAGSLGGVARKTREIIVLCEAAGYDVVIVETVGVGQSETVVHSMVDFFLLLMIAGAGDELQGIKRGIIEMADLIVFNKSDGDNLSRVANSLVELRNALRFYYPKESGWVTLADKCSAITGAGVPNVWQVISDYISFVKSNGYFDKKRMEQIKYLMHQTIDQYLHDKFYQNNNVKKQLKNIQDQLLKGNISPYTAAQNLIDTYFKSI